MRSIKTQVGSFLSLSRDSRRLWAHDWLRLRVRMTQWRHPLTTTRLHLGCGVRHFRGWLNVDLQGSDWNIDLVAPFPWASNSFEAVVSQHVIEHLELTPVLRPMLAEVHRVTKPGGQVWLSCPDMEKVCAAYLADRGASLVADRQTRYPAYSLNGVPTQQVINELFHQGGEHKNLFDFELLAWTLRAAGFSKVERTNEGALLRQFPELPARRDDAQSLYVVATKGNES